jgi:hypothetical protein
MDRKEWIGERFLANCETDGETAVRQIQSPADDVGMELYGYPSLIFTVYLGPRTCRHVVNGYRVQLA